MTLKEKIAADFLVAYKNKQLQKKDLLNVVKSEIQRKEAGKIVLEDKDVVRLIKKMIEDLSSIGDEKSVIEINFLNEYLPKQLSNDTIEKIIRENNFENLGVCMKHFLINYAGQYDGKQVSELFNNNLQKK